MFYKKILFIILLTFFSKVLLAADASDIQSTYQGLNSLYADFTQSTYVKLIEKNITKKGKLYLAKPGKMRIEYNPPHAKHYISDGKKLWIIDMDLDQTEEFKLDGDVVPQEAMDFLNGFGNIDKLFQIKDWNYKKKKDGFTYLTLSPKNKDAQYLFLNCEFNKEKILNILEIHNKSGNVSIYQFDKIRINTPLPTDLFSDPT